MPATPGYDYEHSMGWYNFVTGQTDWRRQGDGPKTDEECRQYIPQWPPALGLYDDRRLQGDTPEEAMEAVLRAATGREERPA